MAANKTKKAGPGDTAFAGRKALRLHGSIAHELGSMIVSGRYRPGHVLDGEWVFTSRAMHFARGNKGPLPSMEQDSFLALGDYGARPLDSLAQELCDLRAASLAQFDALSPEALDRRGVASGAEITVRALLYVLVGHAAHHARVLRERYLAPQRS